MCVLCEALQRFPWWLQFLGSGQHRSSSDFSQGLSTFSAFLRPVQRSLSGSPRPCLRCGCLCCLSWEILGPWQCGGQPWQCGGQPWPVPQQTLVKQQLSGPREPCLPRAEPRQGQWLPSHTMHPASYSVHGLYCPHFCLHCLQVSMEHLLCVVQHLLYAVHMVSNFTDI